MPNGRARQVHGQRGFAEADDDGVPRARSARRRAGRRSAGSVTPAQPADLVLIPARVDALHSGQRTGDTGLLGVLGQQRELRQSIELTFGHFGHELRH